MKSIWIDEDQEAEKLYGIGHTLLLDSDAESQENDLDVTVLNSVQPVLSHKKSIMLPPLKQSSSSSLPRQQPKRKTKGFLKSIFKSGRSHQQLASPAKISTPYDFHHISHASYNRLPITEEEQEEEEEMEEELYDTGEESEPHLSRAFVTESLLDRSVSNTKSSYSGSRERKKSIVSMHRSNSGSIDRSASVSSSNLSKSNSMMKYNRVVSSSTIATSLFEYEDVQLSPEQYKATKIPNFDISHMEPAQPLNRNSGDSDLSISFLKTYNFPTLLEEEEEPQDTTTKDSSKLQGCVLDSFIDDIASLDESEVFHDFDDEESKRHSFQNTPNHILNRRNSDTLVFKQAGPRIEAVSPRFLRSADDLLITDSPNQYRKSFF